MYCTGLGRVLLFQTVSLFASQLSSQTRHTTPSYKESIGGAGTHDIELAKSPTFNQDSVELYQQDIKMSQCRNVAMPQCRNVAMSQCRNVAMSQCLEWLTKQKLHQVPGQQSCKLLHVQQKNKL